MGKMSCECFTSEGIFSYLLADDESTQLKGADEREEMRNVLFFGLADLLHV